MNIGILGGMGPLATADLFQKIIQKTEAKSDQEHIHILIDCNTNIPDRTEAILHGGKDPLPEMVRSAVTLENMGADVLCMSCNTAHYYYDAITPYLHIPFLHMPEETAKKTKAEGFGRVGLLATDGTCEAGVYDRAFQKIGIELIKPDIEGQKAVMDIIYKGIKAGNKAFPPDAFLRCLNSMKARGAEAFILGCTELPLAKDIYHIGEITLDPTSILAEAAIAFAGKKVIAC